MSAGQRLGNAGGSSGPTTSGQAASEDRAPLADEDLRRWLLDELGISEYRRIVREGDGTIVISKFEPGFSQDLFATVELLPELLDDLAVAAEYRLLAQSYLDRGESRLRTAVWREASEALLNRLCSTRGIEELRRMLVLPGIESAQAVIDTILWSAPVIDEGYSPRPGERQAYEEFQQADVTDARPLAGRDMFTRFYGTMDGRRVENYCPGAQYGRRLVAQAWRICTRQRES